LLVEGIFDKREKTGAFKGRRCEWPGRAKNGKGKGIV